MVRFAMAGLGIAVLGACSTRPALGPDPVPSDFVLGITTYPTDAEARARYVVEADGVLRAAEGAGVGPEVFPAETRRLTADERAQLWRLTHATGIFAPGASGQIEDVDVYEPDGEVMVTYAAAGGTGFLSALPLDEPAVQALSEWLNAMARYRR